MPCRACKPANGRFAAEIQEMVWLVWWSGWLVWLAGWVGLAGWLGWSGWLVWLAGWPAMAGWHG